MLVMKTSAVAMSRFASSPPSGRLTSSAILRLPRLWRSNGGHRVSFEPASTLYKVRIGSPLGDSSFTTSAPQSARMPPADGPAIQRPISTTRIPRSKLIWEDGP